MNEVKTTNKIKLESKITFKGVKVTGPNGTKEVKITGDKIEETLKDSFKQGLLKGLGASTLGISLPLYTTVMFWSGSANALPIELYGLLGLSYPLLISIIKAIEGYKNSEKAAKEVGLNKQQSINAGIKGSILGSIKGICHGLIDYTILGASTLMLLSLIPVSPIFTPLAILSTGLVLGGLYNIIKDKVRKNFLSNNR